MNLIRQAMLCVILSGMSLVAGAVDIPTTVLGSDELSKEECIQSTTNDCIESVCMTSSSLDCTQDCKKDAIDKCQEMANE